MESEEGKRNHREGGVEADREIERVIRERHTERVGSWQRSVREIGRAHV